MDTKKERGREAVKAALTASACEFLAELGPKAMTVRDIAMRASVNHGQVYHYFGSKEALVRAAMRELARQHLQNAQERGGGGPIPPALTLGEDALYIQAVVRMVLDGDLDTAALEIEDGVSVPRRVLAHLAESLSLDAPSLDLKTAFAAVCALELGWAALEPFILLIADAGEDEAKAIREGVGRIARSLPDLVGLEVPAFQD